VWIALDRAPRQRGAVFFSAIPGAVRTYMGSAETNGERGSISEAAKSQCRNEKGRLIVIPTRQFSFFDRFWPQALLIAGLGVTVAWAVLLTYELVGLISRAL
jgi:hypothetical protein